MSVSLQIRAALVAALQGLNLVKDVRFYPLNKVQDLRFFEAIPDLGDSAALLISRGWNRADQKRRRLWSLLIIVRDASGNGFDAAQVVADQFDDQFMNTEIMQNSVWIKPGNQLSVVDSSIDYGVLEMTFESEEAVAREVTDAHG